MTTSAAGDRPVPRFDLPRRVVVRAVHTENYRTRTLVLDATLDAYPGQFVMVWLPRFDEKPFSLVDADPVTLMVTAIGPASRLLHAMQPGDALWLRGPFGRGFHIERPGQQIALVGGGYGVAPLLWLARRQMGRAARISAIIGARTARDVLYAGRFITLGENNDGDTAFEMMVTTEDSSRGIPGLVTAALEPLLEQGRVDLICGCGPHGMLAALAELGARHALPTQLSWEAYMRCAVGICGACEHHGSLLCIDGPVLKGG